MKSDELTPEQKVKQARIWLRQGHKQVDIADRLGFSQPYIAKIKREMEAFMRPESILYIEYMDHSLIDNGYEQFEPSKAAAIGVPTYEDDKIIKLRNVWSITLEKAIRQVVIVKKAITHREPFFNKDSIIEKVAEELKKDK